MASRSVTASFVEDCGTPTAILSCARSSSSMIKCTGNGKGGAGSYTLFWQERPWKYSTRREYPSGWYPGTGTEYFFCYETANTATADRLTVDFKVRDYLGRESAIKSVGTFYCAPNATPP